MAKLSRKVGATSQIFQVFIQDSSSTTGAGLTGLVFNTSSLTAYYHRDTDTTATAISLVTMTTGTFTSSGFKEIDATNMPGWYQLCPPNAALASGATNVGIHLKGATNMAPLPLEIDLDAQVDVTFWNGTVVATPATAGIPDVNVKNIAGAAVSTTTAQLGVNIVQVGGQTATAAAPVAFPGAIASTTNITAGTIGSVSGSVASVTARVTANTDQWNGTGVGTVPPDVVFIRSGTAQGGGSTTITLDSGASATNNLYNDAVIFIRSGTGAGQTSLITGYVGSTKVATVSFAWATNPDATSVFTIAAFGPSSASVAGTINANVVQVAGQTASAAAGVTFPSSIASPTNITAGTMTTTTNLTNAPTSGDFTATMKTSLNAATPASVVGAVGSVTGNVGGNVVGSVASVTARVTANSDQLAGQTVTAAAGVTFPGSVASPTNITAGTITTVTNLTNAPSSGDFTSTMKTSLNAATPASVVGAVGSVTGNVGGNVTGSVASVTAAVTVSGTSPMTESYASVGGALTLSQALYTLVQQSGNMSITGTTMTVKKRDGSTASNTYTLNDPTTPTAITQAS